MQSLSKLKASSRPLFLDASVVINLLAADCLAHLADALERPICLESMVVGEVGYHPLTKQPAREALEQLAKTGGIQLVACSAEQLAVFMSLVGATEPDDLDDGEAATLACAQHGGCAALDERKGLRIAAREFPHLPVYTTLDLIFSPQFVTAMGRNRTLQIARAAKVIGRMRVPHTWQKFLHEVLQDYPSKSIEA